MISLNLIVLLVIIAHVLLLGAIVVLNILIQNQSKGTLSDVFFTRFPIEPLKSDSALARPLQIIYYIYGAFNFGGLIVILPEINAFSNFGIYAIIIAAAFGLTGGLLIVMNSIDIYYVKQHVIASTVFMGASVFSTVLSTALMFLIYSLWNRTGEGSIATIVLAVLNGIIAVLSLLLIFNPRLKDWPRLVSNTSGEEYHRPKFFPLAYTEWAFVLLNAISFILFILGLIRF